MSIEICKWYNNVASPVLLMIDDFANVWVDTNGNDKIDLGEDWGYAKNGEDSSFRFLNEVILKNYHNVKVTFFTPMGVRVGMIENPQIKSISKMINCDDETKNFFRGINNNSKFEIAYHGTTHGRVGKTNDDFKQEWELFKNLEQATKTINYGVEIYKEVFGSYPRGGKYCGYEINKFSDDSINNFGFYWWCRYWNRGAIEDKNPLTNYDIKTFGSNKVIDIPSTVSGEMLNRILNPNMNTLKGWVKRIFKKQLINMKLKRIEFLIKNKLVISIQEHMAPARDDGKRQSPNIFDDKESLNYIFEYLSDKDIWYCTGTELAEYVYLRENIKLIENQGKFHLELDATKELDNKLITLKINSLEKRILKMPNGEKIEIEKGIVNVPIAAGEYELI